MNEKNRNNNEKNDLLSKRKFSELNTEKKSIEKINKTEINNLDEIFFKIEKKSQLKFFKSSVQKGEKISYSKIDS